MSAAEMMTIDLARAVEAARTRRNQAIARLTTTGIASRPADETDSQFRQASWVLDRYLANQAAHETSEQELIAMFDRVGNR